MKQKRYYLMTEKFAKTELSQWDWHTILIALRTESARLEEAGMPELAEDCKALRDRVFSIWDNAKPKRVRKAKV